MNDMEMNDIELNDVEINNEYQIVSFQNETNLNKCIVYTFTFFMLILFASLLFVIIFMIYQYLSAVFIEN